MCCISGCCTQWRTKIYVLCCGFCKFNLITLLEAKMSGLTCSQDQKTLSHQHQHGPFFTLSSWAIPYEQSYRAPLRGELSDLNWLRKSELEKNAYLTMENCMALCEAKECAVWGYRKESCGLSWKFVRGSPVDREGKGVNTVGWRCGD